MSSVKVLQINVNRNATTTENILNLAVELNISILAIQEPKIFNLDKEETTTRSVLHSGFNQIMPRHGLYRPRAIYYVSKNIATSLSHDSPLDPDCVVIDVFGLKLVNIYNNSTQNVELELNSTISYTIYRDFFLDLIDSRTILLGDFNAHHPSWDPLSPKNASGDYLIELIQNNELILLNSPGKGTFYRPQMTYSTVIDLTLAHSVVYNKVRD